MMLYCRLCVTRMSEMKVVAIDEKAFRWHCISQSIDSDHRAPVVR